MATAKKKIVEKITVNIGAYDANMESLTIRDLKKLSTKDFESLIDASPYVRERLYLTLIYGSLNGMSLTEVYKSDMAKKLALKHFWPTDDNGKLAKLSEEETLLILGKIENNLRVYLVDLFSLQASFGFLVVENDKIICMDGRPITDLKAFCYANKNGKLSTRKPKTNHFLLDAVQTAKSYNIVQYYKTCHMLSIQSELIDRIKSISSESIGRSNIVNRI